MKIKLVAAAILVATTQNAARFCLKAAGYYRLKASDEFRSLLDGSVAIEIVEALVEEYAGA